MRPLSESTARVAGKCFERKYISLGRIVKHWPDIVGQDLAEKAAPVKIMHRKAYKDKPAQNRLDIATDSANATKLQYRVGLILERINQLFGEEWITSIRFVHLPVNVNAKKAKPYKPPLSENEKKLLSDAVSRITDNEIQARLLSLGEAIAQHEKS